MLTKLSATLADAKALLAKENAELVERVSQLSPLCKCHCNLDENLTFVDVERATAVLASSFVVSHGFGCIPRTSVCIPGTGLRH
jgi:hypothetical protein